jgi:hypothetical protein
MRTRTVHKAFALHRIALRTDQPTNLSMMLTWDFPSLHANCLFLRHIWTDSLSLFLSLSQKPFPYLNLHEFFRLRSGDGSFEVSRSVLGHSFRLPRPRMTLS